MRAKPQRQATSHSPQKTGRGGRNLNIALCGGTTLSNSSKVVPETGTFPSPGCLKPRNSQTLHDPDAQTTQSFRNGCWRGGSLHLPQLCLCPFSWKWDGH